MAGTARLATVAVVALLAMAAQAKVSMPAIFSDNMILQTRAQYGTRAFLSGFANAGELVRIVTTCDGAYTVTADGKGDWSVMLNPMSPTTKPCNITVTGEDGSSVTANNAMVGEVYLCAGDDSMQVPLSAVPNATAQIASIDKFPHFRFFTVAPARSPTRARDVQGEWKLPTREVAAQFSAACFLTAREMATFQVPKGTANASRLGDYSIRAIAGLVMVASPGSNAVDWVPESVATSCGLPSAGASGLWHGVLEPLYSLSIRNALWWQGAADAKAAGSGYGCVLAGLIASWRNLMPIGDFGFGVFQQPAGAGKSTVSIWEGEVDSLPKPNTTTATTCLAATSDLGQSVAAMAQTAASRMARANLHATFAFQTPLGQPTFHSGPKPTRASPVGGQIVALHLLNNTASGLAFKPAVGCQACCASPSFGFEALVNGQWLAVSSATIDSSTGTVNLKAVGAKAIRWGFVQGDQCVLVNAQGLPMLMFTMAVGATSGPMLRRTHRPSTSHGMPLSPPLGFNSWNYYHCNIDEVEVKAIADAMVANGMRAAGYQYLNLDDCWQVQRRANGTIIEDPVRFPSGMKALADYVHSKGLRFGLYTARGEHTCQGRPGAAGHELLDAQTYCSWGLDYLKIDACSGGATPQSSWSLFHQGFVNCSQQTGRFVFESVESCSSLDPKGCAGYVPKVANMWRTGGDVQANFQSILHNIHANNHMAPLASPGHFNDPDMIQVGNVGMNLDEQKTHFALWCIAGAPLLAGTDIVHASNDTIAILTARELLEVDQDLGYGSKLQGTLITTIPAGSSGTPGLDVVVAKCDQSPGQVWTWSADGTVAQHSTGHLLDVAGCKHIPAERGPGANLTAFAGADPACGGANQRFKLWANGSITTGLGDGSCLNVYGGPDHQPYVDGVDVQTYECVAEPNSLWEKTAGGQIVVKSSSKCLATTASPGGGGAGSGIEVWAKRMSDGKRHAVVLANLGGTTATGVRLSFATLNISTTEPMIVRDLWAEQDLGPFTAAYTAPAIPSHGNVALTIRPQAP